MMYIHIIYIYIYIYFMCVVYILYTYPMAEIYHIMYNHVYNVMDISENIELAIFNNLSIHKCIFIEFPVLNILLNPRLWG